MLQCNWIINPELSALAAAAIDEDVIYLSMLEHFLDLFWVLQCLALRKKASVVSLRPYSLCSETNNIKRIQVGVILLRIPSFT